MFSLDTMSCYCFGQIDCAEKVHKNTFQFQSAILPKENIVKLELHAWKKSRVEISLHREKQPLAFQPVYVCLHESHNTKKM